MDIMELMSVLSNKENVEKISGQIGADTDKVKKVVDLGIPTIIQAMGKNAQSDDGAQALLNALQQHQEDDVEGMISNPSAIDWNDGEKILSHILSSKDEQVKMGIAKEAGLGKDEVGGILSQLAPLLMGVMGQQQKQQGVGTSGIASLVTDALGKSAKGGMMDLAAQFLDKDKDGSVVDDIGDMLGGMFGKNK